MNNKYCYPYPKCDVTATAIVLTSDSELLITKRNNKTSAYPGMWCLPGGFINAGKETVEECCVREVLEETGLELNIQDASPVNVTSGINTDPRSHVVNITYAFVIPDPLPVKGMDDIVDAQWIDVDYVISNYDLAFNHNHILYHAIDPDFKNYKNSLVIN